MEIPRIDKYLWCVRVFRTRTLAGDACRGGRVKINGRAVKASYEVKIGDAIDISAGGLTRSLRVSQYLYSRVGAPLVPLYVEDLTDPAEIERRKMLSQMNFEQRDRGLGRPTKRDRRAIEQLKNYLD